MTERGPNKKVANSLVALSSAAVLAVYAAGYVRTRPAANRFAQQAAERRPAAPVTPTVAASAASSRATTVPAAAAPSQAAKPSSSLQEKLAAARPATASQESTRPAAADSPIPAPVTETPVPAPTAPASAPEATPTTDSDTPAEPQAVAKYKDGTYFGWGTSRHGDIQAAVVIEDGHIASATIAQCLTRYSCSVIAALPPQVAQRQSPEVDYVSGATQSADAFYYAVVEALSKAK